MGGRARKGPGRDLSQGDRRCRHGQTRHRNLGRRHPDAIVHVHRRLPKGHPSHRAFEHPGADQPRQFGAGVDQPARGHSPGHRGDYARPAVQARCATRRRGSEQRQHEDPRAPGLGAEYTTERGYGENVPLDLRRVHGQVQREDRGDATGEPMQLRRQANPRSRVQRRVAAHGHLAAGYPRDVWAGQGPGREAAARQVLWEGTVKKSTKSGKRRASSSLVIARISRCTASNATMLALVTATKNSMRTVRDALESAASLRHKVKHYLIDAASSDGTREYLESFVTATGNSVLLSQTGTGLYPALNQAVAAALADPEVTHIGFLHSDDRFVSTQFDEYLSHIDSSRCGFFYSDIEYHDKHDR